MPLDLQPHPMILSTPPSKLPWSELQPWCAASSTADSQDTCKSTTLKHGCARPTIPCSSCRHRLLVIQAHCTEAPLCVCVCVWLLLLGLRTQRWLRWLKEMAEAAG